MDHTVRTRDYVRVKEYLMESLSGQLPLDADPVEFLIKTHASLVEYAKHLRGLLDQQHRAFFSGEQAPPVSLEELIRLDREATPAPWYASAVLTDEVEQEEISTVGTHPVKPEDTHYEETVAQFTGMNKSSEEHAANVQLCAALRNMAPLLISVLAERALPTE